MNIIITSCTKKKEEISGFTPLHPGISPEHYLGDASIAAHLIQVLRVLRCGSEWGGAE